jgi:hypothetical protein
MEFDDITGQAIGTAPAGETYQALINKRALASELGKYEREKGKRKNVDSNCLPEVYG